MGDEILEDIPHTITEAQNETLIAFPSMEEIHGVVKSMNVNSAVGPDGYNGFLYVSCWDTLKNDLYNVVSKFFADGVLPKS